MISNSPYCNSSAFRALTNNVFGAYVAPATPPPVEPAPTPTDEPIDVQIILVLVIVLFPAFHVIDPCGD